MRSFKTFLLTTLIWLIGVGCINTSYSRLDEVEITNDEVYLILGMFAHHGEAFYQNEMNRTDAILKNDPQNFEARNDLASALIKLKRYTEAEEQFKLNEKLHPGRYETSANLGVLYKKMGRFEDSAKALRESFKIKPEGHMGLGDYYLKMVEWKHLNDGEQKENIDFLGNSLGNMITVPNKKHLLTLIKNDYRFPDVYQVLGDLYVAEGKDQLAMRCYYRAIDLKHPFGPQNDMKLMNVAETLMTKVGSTGRHRVNDVPELIFDNGYEQQLAQELEDSKVWLKKYQALEAKRLSQGLAVDFKSMKEVFGSHGLTRKPIIEAAVYTATVEDRLATKRSFIRVIESWGLVILFAIPIGIYIFQKVRSAQKKHKQLA